MTPSSQKSDVRPISFVLHDLAAGSAPITYEMTIRPEDLTRTEPSRLAVRQTFGGSGAFMDNFGPGVASVQISGHTGWHGTNTLDGTALFDKLYATVYQGWHAARAMAVQRNQDPSLVKLVFVDALDNFQWVVAPERFILRRNRAKPLLMQYNISLIKAADDLAEVADTGTNGIGLPTNPVAAVQQKTAAVTSLQQSLSAITDFNTSLLGTTGTALGSVTTPLANFSALTLTTLTQVANAVTGVPLGVAQQLAQAATSVTNSLAQLESIDAFVKGELTQVSSAFRNAFCLIANIFSQTSTYSDYSAFYGASNCSSTWPGAEVSQFTTAGTSGLAALFPATASTDTSTTGASSTQSTVQSTALQALVSMDPVLNPQTADWMSARMHEVVYG